MRVRHYGDLDGVTDESPVCVEIKQRVNPVTQKRRITPPYGAARQLCDRRELVEHSPTERAFIHEVLDLVIRLNLQPTAMTGYQREALAGRNADTGLRVTFDRRIRGRDRDFDFGIVTPGWERRRTGRAGPGRGMRHGQVDPAATVLAPLDSHEGHPAEVQQ